MTTHHTQTWITGQNKRYSEWIVLCFLLLFGGTLLATLLSDSFSLWLGTSYNLVYYGGVLVIGAAVSAYLNDGFVVVLSLTIFPLLGVFLGGVGIGFYWDATWLEYIIAALQGGILLGVPLGVIGFLLGTGIQRLTRRLSGPA